MCIARLTDNRSWTLGVSFTNPEVARSFGVPLLASSATQGNIGVYVSRAQRNCQRWHAFGFFDNLAPIHSANPQYRLAAVLQSNMRDDVVPICGLENIGWYSPERRQR